MPTFCQIDYNFIELQKPAAQLQEFWYMLITQENGCIIVPAGR